MLQHIITFVSINLAFISLAILYGNWLYLFKSILRKKSHSPLIFVGQVTGIMALLIYPASDLKAYWWVPIVLDVYSICMIPQVIRLFIFRQDK